MFIMSVLITIVAQLPSERGFEFIDPTHPPPALRCAASWKSPDGRACAYKCSVAGVAADVECVNDMCTATTPGGHQGSKFHVENACSG